MGVLEHKGRLIWIYMKNPICYACWMCWSYFDFLPLFLGRFFMNGICCLFTVIGSNSHEGHGHYLCHIIEGLDHVFLHVICNFIYGFKYSIRFSSNTKFVALIWSMDSTNVLFLFFITSFMLLWIKEQVLFTPMLPANRTSHAFWNYYFIFTLFRVEELVSNMAIGWVGIGIATSGWVGNFVVTSNWTKTVEPPLISCIISTRLLTIAWGGKGVTRGGSKNHASFTLVFFILLKSWIPYLVASFESLFKLMASMGVKLDCLV